MDEVKISKNNLISGLQGTVALNIRAFIWKLPENKARA